MIAQESDQNPTSRTTAQSLAYVIYTSGSTGTPKGSMIPHRAVNRLVCNTDFVQLEATDRVAQASNVSFDAATFEIWGALLNGGCVVGIERDVTLSPPQFAAALRERRVTTLFLTTALFNQMAREAPGAFRTLRHVLFGGEMCDPSCVQMVLEHKPPERLLHVYGPTENTTFTTWHLVHEVPETAVTVPIGKPIANTTVYILDEHLRTVPIGVPGELYTGGDGLARGYWEQDELTAEKFVADPFRDDAEARLYRTGDVCRWLKEGTIEFMGRRDNQVKIRGFRVELGEVEMALNAHPSVSQSVAMVRQDELSEKRLVAYVVANEGDADGGNLRTYLAGKLPFYMIPSAFVSLEGLPLNRNGKVDRNALPAPDSTSLGLSTDFVPPRNPTEERLVAIWREVLSLEQVGTKHDFFELGGHSLLATQVTSRIRLEFDVDLPLRRLFEQPTVAGLAGSIAAMQKIADVLVESETMHSSPITTNEEEGEL